MENLFREKKNKKVQGVCSKPLDQKMKLTIPAMLVKNNSYWLPF